MSCWKKRERPHKRKKEASVDAEQPEVSADELAAKMRERAGVEPPKPESKKKKRKREQREAAERAAAAAAAAAEDAARADAIAEVTAAIGAAGPGPGQQSLGPQPGCQSAARLAAVPGGTDWHLPERGAR